jgi:hypothetical protein
LLQWAAPEHAAANAQLCKCAQEFVKNLITTQHALPPDYEIKSVRADRQEQKIDVYARVNDDFFIIIEDKTHTKTHDNQLARYRQSAQAMCEDEKRQLVCIYLKTGDESQASFEAIKHDGFAIITRKDLLEFFKAHSVKNAIYNDFVERMLFIEEEVAAFEELPLKEWDEDCWKGFYSFLDTQIIGADWDYAANPQGGLLYFKWAWDEIEAGEHIKDGTEVYLQIESNTGNLCFKIAVHEGNRGAARDEWNRVINNVATQNHHEKIRAPQRFGAGKTMTVAIVPAEIWLGTEPFDFDAVVQRLKEYEDFMKKCVEYYYNN